MTGKMVYLVKALATKTEFDSLDPHGGRRERTPKSCLVTHTCHGQHMGRYSFCFVLFCF